VLGRSFLGNTKGSSVQPKITPSDFDDIYSAFACFDSWVFSTWVRGVLEMVFWMTRVINF